MGEEDGPCQFKFTNAEVFSGEKNHYRYTKMVKNVIGERSGFVADEVAKHRKIRRKEEAGKPPPRVSGLRKRENAEQK